MFLYDMFSEACLLSLIQAYSCRIQTCSAIFWHIQNLCNFCQNTGKFSIRDIFRTLSRYILAYPERCLRYAYREPYQIQNFTMFRILEYLGLKAYSESCLFRQIQAYLGILISDSYNINFFYFNLIYVSTKFKKTCFFDYNDDNFNAGLSLLK